MIILIPKKSPVDSEGESIYRSLSNYTPTVSEDKELKRGKYKCSCCGIQSRPSKIVPSGYMEIINVQDKTELLCRMCYGAIHIDGDIDGREEHGFIIYAPWISQSQLTNLLRLSFLAKSREIACYQKHADTLFNDFYSLIEAAADHLNVDEFTGTLDSYSSICDLLTEDAINNMDMIFKGLRYLPTYDAYYEIIRYWDKATFHKLPTDQWENMLCLNSDMA